MNETIKAIIIGIVQGLTEFLPVSSSGHIVIAQEILGLKYTDGENLLFAIILHFATALSTIVVFRKDIWAIIQGLLKFERNAETAFALKVLLSMIPAVCVGLFLKDILEELFSNLLVVGISLLVTSILLYSSTKSKTDGRDITAKDATIIGLVQAVAALLPGLSRSGSTISASLILGIAKERAAKFSFLMVLPLILGATIKMLLEMQGDQSGATGSPMESLPLVAAFIAAFIAGLLACRWMIALVKRAQLTYFSLYCAAVGTAVIIYTIL